MPIKVANGIYLYNLLFSRPIIYITNFSIGKPLYWILFRIIYFIFMFVVYYKYKYQHFIRCEF